MSDSMLSGLGSMAQQSVFQQQTESAAQNRSMTELDALRAGNRGQSADEQRQALREASRQFEAVFLNQMLNYQYGLTITVIQELDQAAELLLQEGTAAHCVFVVQNNPLSNERTLDSLGHNGVLPLFLVLPQSAIERQRVGDDPSLLSCL